MTAGEVYKARGGSGISAWEALEAGIETGIHMWEVHKARDENGIHTWEEAKGWRGLGVRVWEVQKSCDKMTFPKKEMTKVRVDPRLPSRAVGDLCRDRAVIDLEIWNGRSETGVSIRA